MLNFFLNIVLMVAVFALIFLVRKPNLEKKIQFIQTNSFIIFTYPNPVLLVPSAKTVCVLKAKAM
jgi:hypothetical protein